MSSLSVKKASPEGPSVSSVVIDDSGDRETWLQIVERQVHALKFGSVQVTVHDGNVVQIETSVKVRFDKRDRPA